ncbi:MAG: hypothetical protein AAF798_04795 [Bacteroidota bacterium]
MNINFSKFITNPFGLPMNRKDSSIVEEAHTYWQEHSAEATPNYMEPIAYWEAVSWAGL